RSGNDSTVLRLDAEVRERAGVVAGVHDAVIELTFRREQRAAIAGAAMNLVGRAVAADADAEAEFLLDLLGPARGRTRKKKARGRARRKNRIQSAHRVQPPDRWIRVPFVNHAKTKG